MFVLKSLSALLDRILCVVFAVLLSQGPTYIEQYQDVLAGAEMEAKIAYDDVAEVAKATNQTAEDYLKELIQQAPEGTEVRKLMEIQLRGIDRYLVYHDFLTELQDASTWQRPWVLFSNFDRTLHDAMSFEPNLPLTWEGAAYGFVGIFVGLLVMLLLKITWNMLDFGMPKKEAKKD